MPCVIVPSSIALHLLGGPRKLQTETHRLAASRLPEALLRVRPERALLMGFIRHLACCLIDACAQRGRAPPDDWSPWDESPLAAIPGDAVAGRRGGSRNAFQRLPSRLQNKLRRQGNRVAHDGMSYS